MYVVSSPSSQGSGTHSIESIPPKSSQSFQALLESRPVHHDPGGGHSNFGYSNDVRPGNEAWASFGSGSGGTSLANIVDEKSFLAVARAVHQYLGDHPRVANSAFGKAAKTLVRGAVQLEKAGNFDALGKGYKTQLTRAVGVVETFLKDNPDVAKSEFGKSIADLAGRIAKAISTGDGNSNTKIIDWLIEAAKKADLYLDEYPMQASMPLSQVVRQLTDGVKAMADDNPLDADLQTLAKRVGYFLESHPRLAQSEFGQIIGPLMRGMIALDMSIFPATEPAGARAIAAAAETSMVLDVTSQAAESKNGDEEGMETRRAA